MSSMIFFLIHCVTQVDNIDSQKQKLYADRSKEGLGWTHSSSFVLQSSLTRPYCVNKLAAKRLLSSWPWSLMVKKIGQGFGRCNYHPAL